MADEIDLTTGGVATLDNGTPTTDDDALFIYLEGDAQVRSGTGLYDPFLATRSDGSSGVAEGFNSDADALLDTDAAKTSSLQIETLTVVTIGGVDYYTFRLDLNESPDAVSLNSLKLFTSTAQANEADYSNGTFVNGTQTYTQIFDLDAGDDTTLLLDEHATGSARDDYNLLVPVSEFPSSGYVTMYVSWGAPPDGKKPDEFAEDGGFDEWGTIVKAEDDPPSINIVKSASTNEINEGQNANVTYTYTLTNTGAAGALDPLTLTALVDDKGTPADATDDINLLTGFDAGANDHGDYYVGGDADGDFKLDSNEVWTFSAITNVAVGNVGTGVTNIVSVTAEDDEGDPATDTDDETVRAKDSAPSINIVKTASTNEINEGQNANVTYTYTLTNTSAAGALDPLTLTTLVDDKGTPADATDDINLLTGFDAATNDHGDYYVGGDDDGDFKLDSNEVWTFSATTNVTVGNVGSSVTNIVSVIAEDDDAGGPSATDTDDETVRAKDVAPAIELVKSVDGNGDGQFNDFETVQAFGDTVTYKYVLTNTSPASTLDPLTIDDLVDDRGTASTADDVYLILDGVVQGGVTLVKTNGNADNVLDAGETWTLTADINVNLNPGATITNVATVTAVDDDGTGATDSDTAMVEAIAGPGVRTPGFWSNLGKSFWDGKAGADKSGPNFASGELTYLVDSDNVAGTPKTTGLLIGDYDKDGVTDPDEDTFYISLADALKVIDASQKQQQDTRWVLARDAVATWLNFLAGNAIGEATDPSSPKYYLNQAVDWLQTFSGGNSSSSYENWGGGSEVKASSSYWTVGADTEIATGGHELAGNAIHSQLDFYNNTGMTVVGANTYTWANDGG